MRFDTERPVRYLISAGNGTPETFPVFKEYFLQTIRLAVEARISLLQIREKLVTINQLFELATAAVEITRNSNTKLLINGRADVAAAAGADGVHLPADGVPVGVIRKSLPTPFVIGCSVHTLERAVAAKAEGADFILFGPVFDSGEKNGVGLAKFSEVAAAVGETPVLAVGGIDVSNVNEVIEAGAVGFASIRYLNDHSVLKS